MKWGPASRTGYDLAVFGTIALVTLLALALVRGTEAAGLTVQVYGLGPQGQLVPRTSGHVYQDGEALMVQVDTDWTVGAAGVLNLSWDHRLAWTTVGSKTCRAGQDPGFSQTCPTNVQKGVGPDQVWVWLVYHQVDGQNGPLTFRAVFRDQAQNLSLMAAPSKEGHVQFFPAFYH